MTDKLTWIELSRKNVEHNLHLLANKAGGVDKICAVVKGDAYGHGIDKMVTILSSLGIMKFAVYHPEEAFKVRAIAGPQALIILLGFADNAYISLLARNQIQCLLLNRDRLKSIHAAIPNEEILSIHLKVDTGMNRFGLAAHEIPRFVEEIKSLPKIQLTGAATHYANAWNLTQTSYARMQQSNFDKALNALKSVNGQLVHCHINNTAALFNYPETTFSFVRSGIGIYGYFPSIDMRNKYLPDNPLKPILSFKSRIVSLRGLKVGEHAGYDISFEAKRPTRIALAPVGYSDGFPFAHSETGAFVLIHGQRVPLIGRVNMNAIFMDVTDLEGVNKGDVVTILGSDGESSVSVYDWMDWGTPHLYESLTKLRSGICRIVV